VGLARKIVWFLMSLLRTFKGLFSRKPNADSEQPRSIVIMQREAHQFSEEELRAAAERGWSKRFDGNEDPMFFVSANHPALTVVKAGPHIIRVISAPGRYSDNDQYALSQLRKPEQKKAGLSTTPVSFSNSSTTFRAHPKEYRMLTLTPRWRH
jgi:hypothetical protein